MVSKYDIHWVRIKPGHYMMMPNRNYEIFKRRDGWMIQWFDLWNGRKVIVAKGIPTYSEVKKVCEMYNNTRVNAVMKRWK